jgi:mRNA-degrading endonuclease toxin of MazEF toxin-antitoxin module
MIRPGEIFLADFEEMEPHPVVVVSREELNRGNWVVAVLITSKRFEERSKQPNCVPFRAGEFGLGRVASLRPSPSSRSVVPNWESTSGRSMLGGGAS